LAINAIAGNDILDATEAQSPLIIGGNSTDAVNQIVTVGLNGTNYFGLVAADGTWSATVPAAAGATTALPDGTYQVTADVTDQQGNVAIEARRTLLVQESTQTPPPATPVFDLSRTDQTGPVGSHETQSPVVTLVGQTDPGDTVTLESTG